MILETTLSFLTKSAVQCRVEGLPRKLDQEWLIILESRLFRAKSAGHCRLVSISQYWDCPLFSYWDPTGAWADKSNGVPTLDASYNCTYVEKYVRKIRARTLFTCRSKMFPCNSLRGRRKKGRERGRERGREKSTKEGKGKGVPSPLSPTPVPFSLFPYPLPLSTPATQAMGKGVLGARETRRGALIPFPFLFERLPRRLGPMGPADHFIYRLNNKTNRLC